MSTAPDIPFTGPSLFDDLVTGLAALDAPARLRVVVDVAGSRWELDLPADGARVLVGRADDAGVFVGAAQASRRHAELRSSAGKVSCHDAGSSYGTWVTRDGERLSTPVDLVVGDHIVTAGDVVLLAVADIS